MLKSKGYTVNKLTFGFLDNVDELSEWGDLSQCPVDQGSFMNEYKLADRRHLRPPQSQDWGYYDVQLHGFVRANKLKQ